MIQLAVTRFNDNSYIENKKWRESRQYDGCIYGTSVKIKESISPQAVLIVFEMNNTNNIIEGIGIIKNRLIHKNYNIYNDNNYNRYIYKSNFRLDKSKFNNDVKQNIEKLENILFKGYTHMKRGHGIQIVSDLIKKLDNFDFKNYFIKIFNNYLKDQ